MAKKNLKNQIPKLALFTRRSLRGLLANRKAASVVLSTVILTAGVLAMGIAVLYWATSMGKIARTEYSNTIADESTALMEKLTYEYVPPQSSTYTLTVYLINSGRANDVRIARVYVWDSSNNLLPDGQSFELGVGAASHLMYFDSTVIPSQSLDAGEEGKFAITFPVGTPEPYRIRIVTERGRNFDYWRS